jgi:16S rRNA (guanine966-N2)-methyltransferase
VREATFNALESINALRDAVVLDLFAGTGAMGIEALSRGATAATFVDDDRAAVATVKANLAATGFEGRVVNGDVIHHLRTGGRAGATLVLVDPPYSFDQWDELLALIHDAEVAVAVLESDREIDPGEAWRVRRSKRYGGTVVTIASPAENRFFG